MEGYDLKYRTSYRKPDNSYDEWTIGVYYGEDDLLGYVTKIKC